MHQGRASQLQWRLPIKYKHSPVTLVSTESWVQSAVCHLWWSPDLVPGTRDTPAPSSVPSSLFSPLHTVIGDSWGSIMNLWVRFLVQKLEPWILCLFGLYRHYSSLWLLGWFWWWLLQQWTGQVSRWNHLHEKIMKWNCLGKQRDYARLSHPENINTVYAKVKET